MKTYPVGFDVKRPELYSRAQLALRIVLFIIIGMLGLSLGALFGLLYLGLPAYAAVRLSNDSAERFLENERERIEQFLRRVMAFYAYFALLLDRPPPFDPDGSIYLEVEPTGRPTVSSALLRILFGIPSALVLGILVGLAGLAWLIAFILILVHRRYGNGLFEFQKGVLGWTARLLAYQASLVDAYPPFSLGEAGRPPVPASGQV
jgi:hypothetical protein